MYLTYEEYKNMGGTLVETTFDSLCFEAQSYVDWCTFNRLQKESAENYPEELKRVMFELIRHIQTKRSLMNPGDVTLSSTGTTAVAKMENDGVAVTYNTVSANDFLSRDRKEIQTLIQTYLRSTTNSLGQKLLYRGRYADE